MLHADTARQGRTRRLAVTATVVGALLLVPASASAATQDRTVAVASGWGADRMYRAQVAIGRARARFDRVSIVIKAARSQLGVPYVFASARPGVGFDCSGLVMWAWGRVGVSLPHNSADQYAALPHVPRADVQPGDILFFHSPTNHVAIYLGNGLMIHAPHWGQRVEIRRVYWQYFVGAARP